MKIALIGSALAGGAVQIVDVLLEDDSASSIRIYDDSEAAQGCNVLGVPIVGSCDRIHADASDGLIDSAIVAVGSIVPRQKLFMRYSDSELFFPNIVSSRANISKSASLGRGNVFLPGVYIGPRVRILDNNYFTTSTIVNHDTSIGSHCYFSTCVSIAGRVDIGDKVRFDTGCCVTADAHVDDDSLLEPGKTYGPVRDR